MWCMCIKSLLPPYIPANMSKTMLVWAVGQEDRLCYTELDSMMIAVKIALYYT